jgi:hypothetical protein
LFLRARAAVLTGDKDLFNNEDITGDPPQQVRLLDTIVSQTELTIGYQYTLPICGGGYYFLKLQAEWQQWHDFSSAFVDTTINERWDGPSNVGFAGFGISGGVAR